MKNLTDKQIEDMYKEGSFVMMEKGLAIKIARDCGLACVGLYNMILMHKASNKLNGCYPSYDLLMTECNIGSKATLTSHLSKLVEFGYIKIKSGNRGYSSEYYFPLANEKVTNYTEEDYVIINNIQRKQGCKHEVSNSSLCNLKNYTQQYDDDVFELDEENPFD